jgi:ABC-2 type transport system permease protein
MNFNLIKKVLKDYRISVLLFSLGTSAYSAMMVSIFPSIQSSASDLAGYMDKMPAAFKEAFDISLGSFTTIEGYLSIEYFSLVWVLILISFTLAFTSQSLAGEVDKGTMETLLTQPINRLNVLFSKSFTWLVNILIIMAATFIGVFIPAAIAGIEVSYFGFLIFSLAALIFFWAFFGLGMFFSALFYDRSKAIFAPLGILFIAYLVDLVGKLYPDFEKFRVLSLFKYYGNPAEVMQDKVLPGMDLGVLFGVGLVFFIFSAIVFKRKDIY